MPYPTVQAPVYLPLKGSRASYRPTVIERRPDGVEFYALPEPDGSMIKGGIHDPGPAADPDGARTPDPEQVEDYLDWVTTRFADLDLDRHHAEGCIYTWLPDSRFHLARYGRVILMSCCSGRGFKFLPLTGSRGAAMAREILQPSPTAGVAHGRA